MDFLQNILDNSNFSVLSAFILGLMTALSPCPLATNITAIAFIGKNIENKRRVFLNGIIYTLGRAITYVGIGTVLYFGASKFHIASFFQTYGERILGPLLLIIGIFMLDFIKIRFPGTGNLASRFEKSGSKKGGTGALLMGIVFALAFCPYSGVLYFGMLIPLTVSSAPGLVLPFVFAVATGLPVIIFAYLIAFTLSGVATLYGKLKIFELWLRRVVSALFIVAGLYFIYIYFIRQMLN